MAKIDFPDAAFLNPAAYPALNPEAKKTKTGPARNLKKVKFSQLLETTTREAEALTHVPASEEALQDLLDDVHSAGDELRGHPFPEEIKRYKQAVRNFLHYVVENGYTTDKQEGIPNSQKSTYHGKLSEPRARERKSYVTIQVVDRKLEQLAAGILAGQIAQLELLSRIEEISGLLVDLLQ
jgi:uncharacterized protein YaaR (DUF327 family)